MSTFFMIRQTGVGLLLGEWAINITLTRVFLKRIVLNIRFRFPFNEGRMHIEPTILVNFYNNLIMSNHDL